MDQLFSSGDFNRIMATILGSIALGIIGGFLKDGIYYILGRVFKVFKEYKHTTECAATQICDKPFLMLIALIQSIKWLIIAIISTFITFILLFIIFRQIHNFYINMSISMMAGFLNASPYFYCTHYASIFKRAYKLYREKEGLPNCIR